MSRRRLSIAQARELAMQALLGAGVGAREAGVTSRALVAAECDGLSSHGLARLPFYLDQILSGKVTGGAVPEVQVSGSVVHVDAGHGLAFPAIAAGVDRVVPVAKVLGVAAIAIRRSHHFGVAGHPVESLARSGLLAMAFSNAPSAMAPWGGKVPLFGTNPIAFASPRASAEPLVIDLSLSKVARGKVMLAKKAGDTIPAGWAIDSEGRDTTDPDAALAGSMVPMGDAKGASLALMIELLTAGLTGGHFGFEATSFFDAEGEPPNVAHLLLAIDPARFGAGYLPRAERLFSAMLSQEGVRLPGQRRYDLRRQGELEGILLPETLVDSLQRYATAPP
ncbi:MAG: sulfolactate dehydrogenase [Salinicola sp.]|uniref:Ldh family oxidoreductase n=1 Tax=uncultured Salinicola sp. TaxID=1193542 RepID=UPI000C943902|nr:Ldh family oxidoreductase [uncultured Salinicola sp.]MAM57522.1 sulfolactate dehydrogenase [Salinicola sp.]